MRLRFSQAVNGSGAGRETSLQRTNPRKGERGLAGEDVSVWEYEGTLKVEHQATILSLYSVRLSPDQKQISEVKNARRLETHFRRPQLDLWQLSDTEWLLALRRPEPVARKKPSKITAFAHQLPLPLFGTTG